MTLTFKPAIIAHRGASAYAPENTMAAFVAALQAGAKWLEFDVCLAKDNVPVLFHDKYLKRITAKTGRPCDYTYSELIMQDAGSWFAPRFASERILSLDQALAFIKARNLNANVEIKQMPGQEQKAAEIIMSLVQQYFPQPSQQILLSSFSIKMMHQIRRYSSCNIGLLLHKWKSNWLELAKELNCISVHVNQAVLNKDRAQEIKQQNKYLLVYTVNDPKRAKELFSWGVDAVFSDFPDISIT